MERIEHPADHRGAHLLVADIDAPQLTDAAEHHLRRVRRVRRGEALTVGDGRGMWRSGVWTGETVELGELRQVPQRESLTVGFGVTKGDGPERAVRALAELGIDRIVPLMTDRTVPRWSAERRRAAGERLRRIAVEAFEQSHAVILSVVVDPCDLTEWLVRFGAEGPGDRDGVGKRPRSVGGLARADRGGRRLRDSDRAVLVGPEGGWSDAERELLPDAVGLDGNVLRATTAAIVVGAHLAELRGQSLEVAGRA